MNSYTSLSYIDASNSILNFLSDIEPIKNETELKKEKKRIGTNKQVKSYNISPSDFVLPISFRVNEEPKAKLIISSKFFFNGHDIKIYKAIQQLVETSKKQITVDKIIEMKEKQFKEIKLNNQKLILDDKSYGYKLDFISEDLYNILELKTKAEKQNLNKNLKKLIHKLDHLTIELEAIDSEGDLRWSKPHQLYSVEIIEEEGLPYRYQVITNSIDKHNIDEKIMLSKENNFSKIVSLTNNKDIKQKFNNLSRVKYNKYKDLTLSTDILVFSILTNEFEMKQGLKSSVEFNLEDLVCDLNKHQMYEDKLREYYELKENNDLNLKTKKWFKSFNKQKEKIIKIVKNLNDSKGDLFDFEVSGVGKTRKIIVNKK